METSPHDGEPRRLVPCLREARPEDWVAIASLHIASWRSAYRGILADAYLDGPVEAERRAVWQRRFTEPVDPDQITVLAEDSRGGGSEAPLAFCCILGGHDPEWGSLIDNLHVRPGLSRLRLGRRVLREAAARMPARHADRPIHLTVLELNGRARAAYERWGGQLVEQLDKRESDGRLHAIRRYSWPSPADLVRRLDETPS